MRVNVPLIGELAIIQGETYQALSLVFPGDKTAWTPRGQIRTKLLGDAGTLLAEFSFATPTYDANADATTIYPRLTPAQTASLPETKWQGVGEPGKTSVYYYDIELESLSGEVVKSVPAIVQAIGEVTGPGVPAATGETFVTEAPQDGTLYGRQDGEWSSVGAELGDMTKAVYDSDNDGIVDNSERLNGEIPAHYLDRTNHTGSQAIATITGLESALTGKEPADPTILKNANLGVTVQGYNSNTVTDADYPTVKTTALSAVQPNDLGTASATAATDYATAAQGTKADTALQSDSLNNTALTGVPTAPTAPEGTNTTQLATTAFVLANGGSGGLSNPIDTVFQSIQTVAYNQAGTSTLDNSTHNVFFLAANGLGTTIAQSNVPTAGNRYGFELHLNWTTGTITWPATWTKGDSPPTAVGSYVITGVTVDGGTSFKIAILAEG